MTTQQDLSQGFEQILEDAGTSLRFRYYSQTIGSVWDDDVILSQSGGDLWAKGIVLPVRAEEGSIEANLMEQGKLINADKKVYLNGSIASSGSELQIEVQIGSPNGIKYTTILPGTMEWEVSGSEIYNLQYLRRLTTGSIV